MTLHYVSLFSGIEAFSVAASRIRDVDWNPVFFSEIEPFPCAVLAHHFPTVPNLGDLCKIRIDHADNTATNGSTTVALPRTGIDILAGGSPCQDVSVAGKRAGMSKGSGTRSSLAFEYARLVRELRPRVILWENVPGVLSSNGGRDFAAFLHSLDELGYSLAWRVLDCQYTRVDSAPRAVPQRRRRVWLVGCLGGDGRVPAQILFERAGLLGDTPPRREAGQGFAAPAGYGPARNDRVVAGEGFGETGQGFWQSGVQTLRADHQGVNWPSNVAVTPCGTGAGADRGGRGNDAGEGAGTGTYGDIAETLDASYYKGQGARDGRERALVISTPPSSSASFDGAQIVCIGKEAYNIGEAGQGSLNISEDGAAQTVRADTHPSAVAVFENHAQDSRIRPIDVSDTRSRKDGTGGNNLPLVVFAKASHAPLVSFGFNHTTPDESAIAAMHTEFSEPISASSGGSRAVIHGVVSYNGAITGDVSATLGLNAGLETGRNAVLFHYIVRRLTPGECETLQFFPQGWTKIPWRTYQESRRKGMSYERLLNERGMRLREPTTEEVPDSPRYKSLGNSMATNCVEWILRRIVAAFRRGMI